MILSEKSATFRDHALRRSPVPRIIQHRTKALLEKIEIDRPDPAQIDIDLVGSQTAIEQFGNGFKKYGLLIEPVS